MMYRTILGLACIAASSLGAQQAATGVVIIAHGSDSVWNAPVHSLAQKLRAGGPVEVSFLMGPAAATTRFQDAVARLEARGVSRVAIIPLLVSSASGHYQQIRWLAGETVTLDAVMQHHLHMAGHGRPAAGVPLVLAPALDDAKELAEVLADRARAIAPDLATRAVLIAGHGPNSAEDNAEWMRHLRVVAAGVQKLTGAADVRVGLVRDDAPAPVRTEAVRGVRDLIELQHRATGRDVIVVPVLVSRGAISRDKLPADIAGLPVVYAGDPLLPHDAMARWAERRAREALTRDPAARSSASPASSRH